MGEVLLLDVGHGNCSIVKSDGEVAIIDAGHFLTLFQTLVKNDIDRINKLIISHADKDHIGGMAALLACEEIQIDEVFTNPDSTKSEDEGSEWNRVRRALSDARKQKNTKVSTSLTCDNPGNLTIGDAELEVIWPTPSVAATGPGHVLEDGRTRITSNTASAVLKLKHAGENLVLFSADFDQTALDQMSKEGSDLTAKWVVFPHHGGLPYGAKPEAFASEVRAATSADVFFFSNGRNSHSNPRQEIVEALNDNGNCRVICSQLSINCAAKHPGDNQHLHDLPARGAEDSLFCGGSIQISFEQIAQGDLSAIDGHREFVSKVVGSPMCNRR